MSSRRVHSCIFCSSPDRPPTKLTAEHIWPAWLNRTVKKTGTHNYHWVRKSGTSIQKGKIHRPGDSHSQKLRVACKPCNNGWMSRLQQSAKTVLTPLICDSIWSLSENEQNIASSWITMFTMVVEFADIDTAVIPQLERLNFMKTEFPPKHWKIFIGRHDPAGDHPAFFNHFGILSVSISKSDGSTRIHPIQSTGFTVGSLFVQSISIDRYTESNIEIPDFSKLYDMRQIFPYISDIKTKPFIKHDPQSREIISNKLANICGIPTFSIHSEPQQL